MKTNPPRPAAPNVETASDVVRSHLSFGWWSILLFLSLGILLEALHGFKVGWYLGVSAETRRLLFTLAHAHGTLLGLLNLGFAYTVGQLPHWIAPSLRWASTSLKAATVFLPGGFFAGGVIVHAGDPGLGIVLVPLGAVLLFVAVLLTALAARRKA